MADFDVIINRWKGNRFERPSVTCNVCNAPATVVEINGDRVCAYCLGEAGRKINAALLEAVWLPNS
jgi:uncharacterized CHY-type Zn-finger protein